MSMSTHAFGGSIPDLYAQYLVPLMFEAYAEDLAMRARVPANGKVLETACGTGALTKHLRQVLPSTVHITATDVNPAMVDKAKSELAGLDGIAYDVVDGSALPFEDNAFDSVLCQFGVVFFPDKALGYTEAARVLRPGGSFIFNVWDSLSNNPFPEVVHDTAAAMFPNDPPGFFLVPFGYFDLSESKTALQDAGFADLQFAVLPKRARASTARHVALGFGTGSPLATELAERGAQDDTIDALETELVNVFGGGEVEAPMQAIAVVATLPQAD